MFGLVGAKSTTHASTIVLKGTHIQSPGSWSSPDFYFIYIYLFTFLSNKTIKTKNILMPRNIIFKTIHLRAFSIYGYELPYTILQEYIVFY